MEIGAPLEGRPWITHVNPVDLDGDGLLDILACDSRENAIVWVRQVSRGKFEESVLAANLPAPVHVEATDMDNDGDLDLLVAGMGQVFPSNEKIGSVIILEDTGGQRFRRHDIMTNTHRVTDVRAGDFDGDGLLDLAVGKFGYDQGEITWMRNLGNGHFDNQALLNYSGTVNVCVADMDGNHTQDIVALVSQEFEEVYLFSNDGNGNFSSKIICGSTNEDFGSSGIVLCDVNRDGRLDVIYTNGDGFDYAEPGSRPWHGIQWLENAGGGYFYSHRVADVPGAYAPIGADLDGDGTIDLACVSGFARWTDPKSISMIAFFNDGQEHFSAHILAHRPTHFITLAAGDFDGNGKPVLITGGFHVYPPWDNMSRIQLWRLRE